MNSTNPEENLAQWTPRQPSASLKRSLFPAAKPKPASAVAWAGWLVPMTACLAFALLVASTGGNSAVGERGGGTAEVFPFNNSNRLGGLVATANFALSRLDLNLEWNIWSKATFEWTNGGISPSSNGSLQLAQTNLLMR